MSEWLRDPLLDALGCEHGFGTRDAVEPAGVLRPRQVHGTRVVDAQACRDPGELPEADAVLSDRVGEAVAVVTADCVPVLLAAPQAKAVAAVHAGWRGLAAGVLDAGVEALAARAACSPAELRAAVGPHIGACCYEVDEPVLQALATRHAAALRQATRETRRGHAQLDQGAVARAALENAGLAPEAIGSGAALCTACDRERFYSFRRDGPRAGRLVHYLRVAGVQG